MHLYIMGIGHWVCKNNVFERIKDFIRTHEKNIRFIKDMKGVDDNCVIL